MILGVFFRGFLSIFLGIFWNCELVNICTTLGRQLDFQGLAGFGSACFVLFFGVWFLDGFGNEFLMIFRWIWCLFWLPKSIKNVIDFGIDFRNAEKVDSRGWRIEAWPPRRRLRIPFWYPSGLRNWSPVVQRTRNLEQGLVLGILHAVGRRPGEFKKKLCC